MKLVTYEPKAYLDRFLNDVDPFFGRGWPWRPNWDIDRDAIKANVKVNIEEQPDHFTLTAQVPGMKEGDIDLQIHDGRLTLKGETQEEKETDENNYHLREFHKSSFERSFTMGDNVDPAKVKAKMENGVLTVYLPKKEEVKPKSVKVEIGK